MNAIEDLWDEKLNPIQKDFHEAVVKMMGTTMLWGGLGEEDRESIVTLCKERSFEARDKIVKKGDKGTGFYLILEGSVEIKSGNTTLAKFGTGQFFGEMSLLDGEPRSADVVASEPTRCLVLNAQELNEIVESNPKIATSMLRELTRRLRATTQSIRE
jgi:CRP-like cAMP-binding protein